MAVCTRDVWWASPFVLKVVQDPAEPKSLGASMLDGIVRDGARSGTTTCLWPFLAQSGTPTLGPSSSPGKR